jgi:hypothetical protein
MKIKIITGFREDQQYSVDIEEAHKAYYLFMNPEARTVFSNGLALLGADIRRIEPDWHGTMGWNPGHKIDEFDWQEINRKGIKNKINDLLDKAKDVAIEIQENTHLLSMPLSKIDHTPELISQEALLLGEKMKN